MGDMPQDVIFFVKSSKGRRSEFLLAYAKFKVGKIGLCCGRYN